MLEVNHASSSEGSGLSKQESNKNERVVNFDDDEGIFYKPKRANLRVINEVTASK